VNLIWKGLVVFIMIIGSNVKAEVGATLKVAIPIKQLQLDSQKIEDMYSMTVVNQIYAKLFRFTPDGQVRPDLVAKWTLSENKTTYTFHLRKTQFSDGSLITALHVANSLKRIFLLKAALSGDLSIIKGAKAFFKTKKLTDLKIHVIDSHTLEIETEKPTALLIYLLAVPDLGVHKIEDLNANFNTKGGGPYSGPYSVSSITDDRIELQKWRKSDLDSANPPDRIHFNLMDKIAPERIASGEISDTSSFMTFDSAQSPLEGMPGWRPVPSEASNERFIVMNPNKVPLEVRRWMLSQVNSSDFVTELGDKTITPAFGFIPNCLPGHLKKSQIPFAPEPKLSKPLKLKITFGENLPYPEKFKSYLNKVWSRPWLRLEFKPLPVAEYLNVMFKKKGEIVIGARGLDYPEGYSTVTYFRSDVDSNFFFVKDKEIDRLIETASQELDSKKRADIYEVIQEKVLKGATVIPLAFGTWKKYYWSDRVKQAPAHPIGVHFVPLEMLSMAEK